MPQNLSVREVREAGEELLCTGDGGAEEECQEAEVGSVQAVVVGEVAEASSEVEVVGLLHEVEEHLGEAALEGGGAKSGFVSWKFASGV